MGVLFIFVPFVLFLVYGSGIETCPLSSLVRAKRSFFMLLIVTQAPDFRLLFLQGFQGRSCPAAVGGGQFLKIFFSMGLDIRKSGFSLFSL
jgi:hypothetical protein